MKREPTEAETEKISNAIFEGDRIEATSLYISITEVGLTEAQAYIKTLTEQLQTLHPEKFTRNSRKRRW